MPYRKVHLPRVPGAYQLRAAVGVCLIATPLALGGAHPQVNAILAAALLVVSTVYLLRRNHDGQLPANVPVLALVLALFACALQLVPAPMWLVRLLAPTAADVFELQFGDSLWFVPLSLDPPATAHGLLVVVICLTGALLSLNIFGERQRQRELLAWIAVAGAVVTGVGLFHALAQLDRPYGVYGQAAVWFTSSFINPNHLAAFLGFSSLVALGLAVASRGSWRAIWLGDAALCGAGVFLSLSRGGIIAYVAALAFLALPLALDQPEKKRNLFWVQLGLAGSLIVAGYLAYTQIVREMWTLGRPDALDKALVWRPVLDLLGDFPVLGIGRGALPGIYAHYSSATASATFTHLENEYLQTLVDFGPVLGLVILGLLALAFGQALKRAAGKPERLGAVTALLFLGIHNLGDFNLELSAVALPAFMVLTVLASKPSHSRTIESKRGWVSRLGNLQVNGALAWVVVVVLAGLVGLAAYPAIAHRTEADTARLRRALVEKGSTPAGRAAAAEDVIRRHPADSVLPLMVAERELYDKDGAARALRFANRGMFLAPHYYGGHLLAARALLRLGHVDQGLIEYRLVLELEPSRAGALAAEIFERTNSLARVRDLVTAQSDVRLQVASFLLTRQAPADALEVLELPHRLDSLAAYELMVRALNLAGRVDEARQRAEEAQRRWPGMAAPYLMQGQMLAGSGNAGDALAVLERGIATAGDPTPLFAQTIGLLMQQGRFDAARKLAKRQLDNLPAGPAKAQAYWSLGDIYAREGSRASALREYQRARDLQPANLGYRMGIASLREAMGDVKGARAELLAARAYAGNSGGLEAALQRLETRIQTSEDALRRQEIMGVEP
ncbi:MAG: O-antigen ligase family protein [Deltaproteobacteria bacterium]|nr:O-antigen ligase family protein [Deltaproteobacteria bacterium]